MLALALLTIAFLLLDPCKGFQSIAAIRCTPSIISSSRTVETVVYAKYDDGEVGEGPNWIEKSFPVETDEKISTKKVEDYNLGISGEAFQTGPLSKRMFEAIMSKTSLDSGSDEIRQAFTLYAMDFTAKEAARAALAQNGLEMVLTEDEEDQGMWGDVEAIRLYDEQAGIAFDTLYDSLEEAVPNWTPGQPFDFVVRQVPAKIKELSVDELLKALDPDGSIRNEAKSLKNEDQEEILSAIFDDDEGLASLADMATINVKRTESTPQEATPEGEAFAGGLSRGYRVIKRKDLLPVGQSENEATIMHVMNALVAHGVILVDLTDGDESLDSAETLSKMWNTANKFFEAIEDESVRSTLPAMATIAETGSKHAKVGYADADNGSMKFLESRRERLTGEFLPAEASLILGDDGISAMQDAFDIVTNVGKDVVRIATAASSVEHGAFGGTDEETQLAKASQAAELLADELVDDGKPLTSNVDIDHTEGKVGMSPHRLCRYVEANQENPAVAREVFGAHVDSSFVTIVPVASISGLEVYDEEAEKWYRPELKAKAHWKEQKAQGASDSSIPWHCRYVAIMPGEYLQLATRDEVPAAVHRVVAARGGNARLSAPILLRGRPGTTFSSKRYLGGSLGNPLIEECDGKTMEEIHDLTQPSSFQ
mmetsp:Transcript_49139/g.141254  ORF Transcript_49139/g.141254 Transcript_49139/m.141254 type:complete len:654 (+) Transcript_49139:64-2025(+)